MTFPVRPLFLTGTLVAAVVFGSVHLAEAKRPKARFVYAHDGGGTNQVFGYRLETDGTLTPLDGSPFATGLTATGCGGLCQTLSYSKKRRALIASGSDGLAVLLVGEDGALTLGAGSPLLPDTVSTSFNGNEAVDKGKSTFVYANEYGIDSVRGYTLAKDGGLTELEGSPWPTGGAGPDGMTVAQGKVLLCMNEDAGSIASFRIGRDGTLTPSVDSPFAFDTDFSWNLHVDPPQKTVYAGDDSSGDLYAFRIDFRSGALTPVPDSPFVVSTSDLGSGVSFARSKRYPGLSMHTAGADGPLQAVKVNGQGALTLLGETQTLPGLGNVDGHARTRDGKVLVVAGGSEVKSFAVAKTGAITELDVEALPVAVNDLLIVE